jgi:hypothetical protein
MVARHLNDICETMMQTAVGSIRRQAIDLGHRFRHDDSGTTKAAERFGGPCHQ